MFWKWRHNLAVSRELSSSLPHTSDASLEHLPIPN